MPHCETKLYMTLKNLEGAMYEPILSLTDIETAPADYKSSNIPVQDGYQKGTRMYGPDQHFWQRCVFDTPKAEGELCLRVDTGISGWDGTNPQFILYLNGRMSEGLDVNHRRAWLAPATHYELYNYCYSSNCAEFEVAYTLERVHPRIRKLYYDLFVPYTAATEVYEEHSTEYAVTMRILEEAANLIDQRAVYSEEYFESIERALAFMETEYYGKLCTTSGKPTVNCLGHTHIDIEWRWDRAVTREKIQRSFATAKSLMDRYPEYRFMLSQPELYRYLKEEAPEKYEELRALVREGRWEPEGAMYVECDCNLVSGESLVRQIMKGTQFFKREFGTDCHVLFLPDVFGYSAAMPQILKKSGIDYFVTSKISWNDTNTMPHDTFLWQGIDGTEIFSAFITGQQYTKGVPAPRHTTYVGHNDPTFLYGTYQRQSDKAYVSSALNVYGYGDGGGGPTDEMLEHLVRMQRGLPGLPVATSEFLYPYMQRLEREFLENAKRLRRTPKWIGDLYLEYHRGTYTTMADNKKNNRRMELELQKCEALSVTDLYFGGDYDIAALDDAWMRVLHDQFHDILPGSSIGKVYENTREDYRELFAFTEALAQRKLSKLAAKINTDGGILVYNPLGFARRGSITVDGKTYITDTEIPPLGYAVIRPTVHTTAVSVGSGRLENDVLRIEFSRNGSLREVFDKRIGRNILAKDGAELRFYEDYPKRYDAWELEKDYATKAYIPTAPADEQIVYDGDRVGICYTVRYMKSTVRRTYYLSPSQPRLDIEVDVDWHERHQLMKLAFPLDIHAPFATYEIQYAHIQRPTHRNTSWDAAKYEVCAHKWVDLSENGYGVALLNDAKYGYSVLENELTVTCLRSPTEPYPEADEGEHHFTLSLLGHVGTLAEGRVIEEAYSLNQPLVAYPLTKHAPTASSCERGVLPDSFSLASSSNPAVIIECAKRAEADDALILRLYEAYNGHANTTLTVANGFSHAYLCDLMENTLEELDFNGKNVNLSMKNFEITTLKFTK